MGEYSDYIESYQILGSSQNKEVIDVLIVKLKGLCSKNMARTIQRNFIAKYLKNKNNDYALVAFYGDNRDWKFSFVKMKYNSVKELTSAKRYSFLVGVNEPTNICINQFLKLIMGEKSHSLLELENAFNLNNVTNEFFNEFKELFLELEGSLKDIISKDNYIKEEFENKGISSVDFAKRLLGQILFIYFLQKKMKLEIKDGQMYIENCGCQSKKFMSELFDKKIVHYTNFFNEILEPLFYKTLANEIDNSYYNRFSGKIHFLNSGLFEPLNDYDWVRNKIVLDNCIFERILKTFDKFNFTFDGDEPLEKEVAVSIEMFENIFESLQDIKK